MRRLLLIAAILFLAPPLGATVLVPADFREVVAGSQVIVHGRVVDVRADWTTDRFRIETFVTLEAGSYLKGGPGERVTFRVPGGTIGRYRSLLVGAPEFRVGEEVVMFLKSDGPAVPHVFGLSQGVFRVRHQVPTGERVVMPPVLMADSATAQRGGRAAADRTGRGIDAPAAGRAADRANRIARGAADRQPVSLDVFRAQVRAAMSSGGVR